MFLSNQYVSEKIVEIVKFRWVKIFLFPHLPPPILKRHCMYSNTHDHSHNQLTYMHNKVIRLLPLPPSGIMVVSSVNQLILWPTRSRIVTECPLNEDPVLVLAGYRLNDTRVHDRVPVRSHLSLVAPLEIVHVGSLVPEHKLEYTLKGEGEGEEK